MFKTGLIFAAFAFFSFTNFIQLDEVRGNYNKVIKDEVLCKRMIKDLEIAKNKSNVYLAYLGGFQTIWANHVFSPIRKLNTFKEGKRNIEQAIKNEPNNVEIRFIRFSIQKNSPSFLGYKSNLKEDEGFISKNRYLIKSEILQKNIDSLLK